jgi:hypothetical protein
MHHEDDQSRNLGPHGPGTTRRTWVRAAANAVWAVPLVSVVTSAPAHAAASTAGGSLAVVSADFYVWPLGAYFCVDPLITVTNPTTRDAGALMITLQFSTTDFVGTNTFQQPPTPSYVDLPIPSSDGSWAVATNGTQPGDTAVSLRLTRDLGLAAGGTTSVGGGNTSAPFGIAFANNPTATSLPMVLQASGAFEPVTAALSRIPRPR